MLYKLGIGILIFFVVTELILLVVILIRKYDIASYYNNSKKRRKKISIGSWHGGTFYAEPFFPINRDKIDKIINKRIKLYNLTVYLFWGNILTLFLSLLILNLSDITVK